MAELWAHDANVSIAFSVTQSSHECTQLHLGLHWGADTRTLLLCKQGLPLIWTRLYLTVVCMTDIVIWKLVNYIIYDQILITCLWMYHLCCVFFVFRHQMFHVALWFPLLLLVFFIYAQLFFSIILNVGGTYAKRCVASN